MPCDTIPLTEEVMRKRKRALDGLKAGLAAGTITVTIDRRTGALAFTGWDERSGRTAFLADLCAYRALTREGYAPLRAAISRAETLAGRPLSKQAIAAGVHSHDGGATWGSH